MHRMSIFKFMPDPGVVVSSLLMSGTGFRVTSDDGG